MTDHTVNRTNRQEGRQEILVGQVCKKLRRQKSVPEIAEALEEDEAVIQRIYDIAGKYAPDYDEKKICKEINGMKQDSKS